MAVPHLWGAAVRSEVKRKSGRSAGRNAGNGVMTKYIFVTGGVVSGLGKGITAASAGRLLKSRGRGGQKLDRTTSIPGVSPYRTARFTSRRTARKPISTSDLTLSSGRTIFRARCCWNVLNGRRGDISAQQCRLSPITNEIRLCVPGGQADRRDVVITEIGGTIGDIESQPFIEAVRQISLEVGRENSLFIHVTLVPFLRASGEHKSKPTQHSVKELQGMGINPNIIVLRADEPIEDAIYKKISLFCNVKQECVIENVTLTNLYEAPLMLEKQNFSSVVCKELNIHAPEADLTEWELLAERIKNRSLEVHIGLVGKYIKLHDAYLSVSEALSHAGYELNAHIRIHWIDSESLTKENCCEKLSGLDGIIIPGGFGDRGIDGMIAAAKYARENGLPYFGICLGMQIAVIEYARNVLGIPDAHSGEFDEQCLNKVIDFMPGQSGDIDKGGTLRLGSYPCVIKQGTKMADLYGKTEITERHRHRYEFNNDYREAFEKTALRSAGSRRTAGLSRRSS